MSFSKLVLSQVNEANTIDVEASKELFLYVINTVEQYNNIEKVVKALAKFNKKGTYSSEEAIKSYLRVVDSAAKAYVKDYANGNVANIFNGATKLDVAKKLEKEHMEDVEDATKASKVGISESLGDEDSIGFDVNENSNTFHLVGPGISFTGSSIKDRAINILLKHDNFDHDDLVSQLGSSATNLIVFKDKVKGPVLAKMAYAILLKSDIEKASFDDANKFSAGLYKDISSHLTGLGYKVKKGSTNGFHILSKDGLVTAYVVADPQNKF